MKKTTIFSVVFAILSFGCGLSPKDSTDRNKPKTYKEKVGVPISKNKSLDEVVFKFPNAGCPVVLFFDAQAAGSQFLNRYGDVFNSQGMGVVASNKFRNGITGEESGSILKHMMQIAEQNGADLQQLYLMGFSGGGKFVQNLADVIPNVKAVVTFGVGKRVPQKGMVPEINIMGLKDLNFAQAMMYPLRGDYVKPDLIITHDGGHEWPPEDILDYVLKYCMSGFSSAELTVPVQQNERVTTLNKILNDFSDEDRAEALQKLQKLIGSQIQREQNWMARVQKMYQSQHVNDWENMLRKLKTGESDAYVKGRVEGYLSMVNYILASNYINSGDLNKGHKQLSIYKIVDPGNSDVKLLQALSFAKQGEYVAAVKLINEAISQGFSGYQKLMYMNFPSELTQREDFVLTLEKIYPE